MAILRKHEEYIRQNFSSALNSALNAAYRFYNEVDFSGCRITSPCKPSQVIITRFVNYQAFVDSYARADCMWHTAKKFKVDLRMQGVRFAGDILVKKTVAFIHDNDLQTEYMTLYRLQEKISDSMMDEIDGYVEAGGKDSKKIMYLTPDEISFKIARDDEVIAFREQARKDLDEALNNFWKGVCG